MKALLIATTNPAKRKEVELILGNFGPASTRLGEAGISLKSLADFPGIVPPEETGNSFLENAVLKAKYYFEATGIPVLADDGGLMVDALGGLPGVHSHRWLGREASDLELAQEIVKRVNAISNAPRTARLGGYAVCFDGVNLITSANFAEGSITTEMPREVEEGFPYRSVLIITKFNKIYRDLTHEEHAAVNHRRKNLEALKPRILELLKSKNTSVT